MPEMKGIPAASIFLLIVIIVIIGIVAWGIYANFPAIRAWASKFFTIAGPSVEEQEGEFSPLDMLSPGGYQKYAERMSAMWRPEVSAPSITAAAQPYVAIEFPTAPVADQPIISNETLERYGTGVSVTVKNAGDSDVYNLNVSINVFPPTRMFEVMGIPEEERPKITITCEGFPVTGTAVTGGSITGMAISDNGICEEGESFMNVPEDCCKDDCTACSDYDTTEDCTSDTTCHEECDGYNGCAFADSTAKTICDDQTSGTSVCYDADNTVTCCESDKVACSECYDCSGGSCSVVNHDKCLDSEYCLLGICTACPSDVCGLGSEVVTTGTVCTDDEGITRYGVHCEAFCYPCSGCYDCQDATCTFLDDTECAANEYCLLGICTACPSDACGDVDSGVVTTGTDCVDDEGITRYDIINYCDASCEICTDCFDCQNSLCSLPDDTECLPGQTCDPIQGVCKNPEVCDDVLMVDEDGDNLANCADSDCFGAPYCSVESGIFGNPPDDVDICFDIYDNDLDGCYNGTDFDCGGIEVTCADETSQDCYENCADGLDNDCDGLIDCDDDCIGQTGPEVDGISGTCEATETTCDDNYDNDVNGDTDCEDSACDTKTCGVFMECSSGACGCVDNYYDCSTDLLNWHHISGIAQPGCLSQTDTCKDSCIDGQDYDGDGCIFTDGVVDNVDVDCNGVEATCGDGKDNDCDGLIDCKDTIDCFGTDDCAEHENQVSGGCSDGIDNDADCTGDTNNDGTYCGIGDINVDCGDPDCMDIGITGPEIDGKSGICESQEESCSDEYDNDVDGLMDCADSDCFGLTDICDTEDGTYGIIDICKDGEDNDGDGCADGVDSDCDGKEASCVDGKDNDCDGLVDCRDDDCRADPPTLPCEVTETRCNDGIDNDGNGKIDCADDDCLISQTYCAVKEDGAPNGCADNFDNDGDGDVDCDDTDCTFKLVCTGGDVGAPCASDAYCMGLNLECNTEGIGGASPTFTCVCKEGYYDCWDNIAGCEAINYPDCIELQDTPEDDDGDGCLNLLDYDLGGTETMCPTKPGDKDCYEYDHCGDGKDNDCDGLVDCEDSDCERITCDDYSLCEDGSCKLIVASENIIIPVLKRGFTKTIRCRVTAENTQQGDSLTVYSKVETNYYQRAYQPLFIVSKQYADLLQSIGDYSRINSIATEVCRGHSPCSFINSYGPAKVTNLKYLPIIDDVGTTTVEARVQVEAEGKISEIFEFLYLVPKELWAPQGGGFFCEGGAMGGCTCADSYMELSKGTLFAASNDKVYKFDGDSWTESHAVSDIRNIEYYKNRLYLGSMPNKIFSYDGSYWSDLTQQFDPSNEVDEVICLDAIDDILFIGEFSSVEDNAHAKYDGTSFTGWRGPARISSFGYFDGSVYAGNPDGIHLLTADWHDAITDTDWQIITGSPINVKSFEVYEDMNMFYAAADELYNSSDGYAWSKTEIDVEGTSIDNPVGLIVHENKLYAASDKVYEFNGNSWKKLLQSPDNPISFVTYGNKLYVGTKGRVYSYDGMNWVLEEGSPGNVLDMAVFEGKMKYLPKQETAHISLEMLEATKEFKFCLLDKYRDGKDNLGVGEKYSITLKVPVLENSKFDTFLLPVLTVYKFSKVSPSSTIDVAVGGT